MDTKITMHGGINRADVDCREDVNWVTIRPARDTAAEVVYFFDTYAEAAAVADAINAAISNTAADEAA